MKEFIISRLIEAIRNPEVEPIVCAFDRVLRDERIVQELFKLVKEDSDVVVCSGKFGKLVEAVFRNRFIVVIAPGGIRGNDGKVPDLSNYLTVLKGTECVFVDDGIYTGKTQQRIIQAVENQGGKIIKAYYVFNACDWLTIPTEWLVSKDEIRGR